MKFRQEFSKEILISSTSVWELVSTNALLVAGICPFFN